jgi:hypothetical protein
VIVMAACALPGALYYLKAKSYNHMYLHQRHSNVCMQGDLSIAMGEGEVASALKAGQDAGRLPQLTPGKDVGALLNALAYDSLGVSGLHRAVGGLSMVMVMLWLSHAA